MVREIAFQFSAATFPASKISRRPLAGGPLRGRGTLVLLGLAFFAVPWIPSDYLFSAILLPFLALGLAGVGLNLLTGYAGQVSVGSAAFMATGAFTTYNLALRLPHLPLVASMFLGGVAAALVGVLFGLPSLRLRGFYLLVSTLAAQYFVQWVLTNFPWFSNNDPSGVVTPPALRLGTLTFTSPSEKYVACLAVVAALTWVAHRLARSQAGRNWIAVRDMDVAAAVIGVPIFRSKLIAFAISSFYCGVAGVLWSFAYLGTIESDGFSLDLSFKILFIIIIGGLASVRGAFFGAALMVVFPLVLSRIGAAFFGGADSGVVELVEMTLVGLLIIIVLRAEPAGVVSLWDRARNQFAHLPFSTESYGSSKEQFSL